MEQIILIAEPRELVRAGLKAAFLDDERVSRVYEATTTDELETQLQQSSFDLIVVNQVLITQIELLPQKKFVVLSPKPDMAILKAAYMHQGCGYLSDHVSTELLRTMLTHSKDAFLIEPGLTPLVMDNFFHSTFASLKEDLLTEREKEIVGLLRKGIDRTTIAKKLCITDATLKTHIKNLSRKR